MGSENSQAQPNLGQNSVIGLNNLTKEKSRATQRSICIFHGNNLNATTFSARISLKDFIDISQIANRDNRSLSEDAIAQRPLDDEHAKKLAIYILKGLVATSINFIKEKGNTVPDVWLKIQEEMGKSPYVALQPIVVNIRSDANTLSFSKHIDRDTNQIICNDLNLSQEDILWVIDGQHRRRGMEMVVDYLKNININAAYPKKGLFSPSWCNKSREMTNAECNLWETCRNTATQYVSIVVEIHIGLSVEQERQLFYDLNELGKKTDTNTSLSFDCSNPINKFTREFVIEKLSIKYIEKEVKDWNQDDGGILLKDLVNINSRLFINRTNPNDTRAFNIKAIEPLAERFWNTIIKIPHFGEKQAKKKTVAAQTVILKSLAKLIYDFGVSKKKPNDSEKILDSIFSAIDQTGNITFDFSHSNPAWRYYSLTEDDRKKFNIDSLSAYLPKEDKGNRDIGAFQDGLFRFGSKINDIVPLICDIFRWRLNLPSRL